MALMTRKTTRANQEEVDDGADERPDAEGDALGDDVPGLVHDLRAQGDVQRSGIGRADEIADGGHDHVVDQRGRDLAKGGGDDDTDCHIDHVAAADERLKLTDQATGLFGDAFALVRHSDSPFSFSI